MDILENTGHKAFIIPRRVRVVFFVVETSGIMKGSMIGEVNSFMEEAISELKDLSEINACEQIKVAVLGFSTGARWFTPNGPAEVENFIWNDLDAYGATDFGDACRELNNKLSTKVFMREETGAYAPVIFLLSSSGPTDDYQESLEALKHNNWFKAALKVAVAIGKDADKIVLEAFTGNSETVLEGLTSAMLRKMLRNISAWENDREDDREDDFDLNECADL